MLISKKYFNLIWGSVLSSLIMASPALALDPIVRTYHSVRAEGMGNVRYTTGMYEENFYGNPALMANIPESRFQLPKFSIEAGSEALSNFSAFTRSKGLSGLAAVTGKPLSARAQFLFPAYYKKEFLMSKWAMGVGVHASFAAIGHASQSNEIYPGAVMTMGPAITFARRLLEEDRLLIGFTTHFDLRATSGNSFSVLDFLRGSVASSLRGGSGMGLDFDLGTSFRPHWGLGGFSYNVAFAVNNLAGGKYNNVGGKLSGWSGNPIPSPRSVNFGVSAQKPMGPFQSVILALEFTDIGNNDGGSFYKTIHMGAEAKLKSLALRTGLNQGYLTGGLGCDVGFFAINLSTYGEELGLNAGILQDRRYAIDFGFQI